jgi:5-methylcytosine-specific restriction endonuclease McrA
MWTVTRPTQAAATTYLRCISRVRDPVVKQQLLAATDDVRDASQAFDEAAAAAVTYQLTEADFESAHVSAEQLQKTYTKRMAPQRAPGRVIYDELKLAAPYGICPLCGQRPVASLDHHLPKSRFPLLSVAPLNLVPACSDCNHVKEHHVPRTADDQTLHPYFDDVESDAWLKAVVLETAPAAVQFHVAPPAHWSPTLRRRVKLHFERFGLPSLYTSQAAVELSNIRVAMERAFQRGGTEAVRVQLLDHADSRLASRLNSWQTATYGALTESAWYCAGGFAFR